MYVVVVCNSPINKHLSRYRLSCESVSFTIDLYNASALPVAVRFVTETYQTEIETESDKNGGKE